MYPPRRQGTNVAIRGDRIGYGGCPTPMPYPPVPVRPIRDVPDNGGPDSSSPLAGSFTVPNQSVPEDTSNAPVALGSTNFSDGISLNGNQIVVSKKGVYMVTFNALIKKRDNTSGEVIVTFNMVGNVIGAPNPIARFTMEDSSDSFTVNVPMIVKIPSDSSSISFTVTANDGVPVIEGGTVSMSSV